MLGVIVAITLASTANLHLQFNQIEDTAKKEILRNTRSSVRRSAWWLIYLFSMGLLLVIIKPLLPESDLCMALANGGAILIVVFNILVLTDLTKLAFSIPPRFKLFDNDENETEETDS